MRQSAASTLLFLAIVLIIGNAFAQSNSIPDDEWQVATPVSLKLDEAKLKQSRDYALTGGGSGMIVRYGKAAMTWGDLKQRYDLKSTTKSIGVTALGLAISDGKLSLNDKAKDRHPQFGTPPNSNRDTGWVDKITLKHLATQTAGFEKPGGYAKLVFQPGTKWAYSDGGPNWLAECVTLAYKRDVNELMFERVFTPLHISRDDLQWRRNSYRDAQLNGVWRREFGSGVSANVDAMARIGLLYLNEGKWGDAQIIPADFVKLASTTPKELVGLRVVGEEYGTASNHYGLLWWNNGDGALKGVPRDAYWSWGLYDSLIVVIPSLDMTAARAGKSWRRGWDGHYDVLAPFLQPLCAAAEEDVSIPIPPPMIASSPVIETIHWEPANTIVRRAKGSDNWPITWGEDGLLYTAYGDGRGFEPFVERKLSLGLATIDGDPANFKGVNLRAATAERTGGGKDGPKASSLLMVDGALYMWVRNTGNSQLVVSQNRGRTWKWMDWKFTTSFGYPVFLNFGKNNDAARDDFVYLYSPDDDSAYKRADRMVLARVPKSQITNRKAYEFFVDRNDAAQPQWSSEIAKRGAVFENHGKCYRCSVSYNAPLKRYLWHQTGVGADTRFRGGFGVYDSPEPWGPWTIAFQTDEWDVGPGETGCLPVKWMSDDGKTVHVVFSGDDSFSVRKGSIILRR